jgi:hypothetical protein
MRRTGASRRSTSIRFTIACASPDCNFSTTTFACCTSSVTRISVGITSTNVIPSSITVAALFELPLKRERRRRKMPNVSVTRIAPMRIAVMNGQMIRNAA